MLPGFVILGFGVELVFPAASIAAPSEVDEESVGLASGLIATGHELGPAVAAAISAVATAASTFVGGCADDSRRSPRIAVLVATIALVAIPTVRPGAEVARAVPPATRPRVRED